MDIDTKSSSHFSEGFKSRCEIEMWPAWIEENPGLFARHVMDFKNEYPSEEWKHHISFHSKTVKLIAIRRTEKYVPEQDYLKEIGMR